MTWTSLAEAYGWLQVVVLAVLAVRLFAPAERVRAHRYNRVATTLPLRPVRQIRLPDGRLETAPRCITRRAPEDPIPMIRLAGILGVYGAFVVCLTYSLGPTAITIAQFLWRFR